MRSAWPTSPNGQRRSRRPQHPCLVLCHDAAALRIIRSVTQRENIPVDVCADAAAAIRMSAAKPYQALLVDLDIPGAGHFMNSLRELSDRPVTLAMVASGAFLGAAFDSGATLAIHKPVAVESLRLGLKAAYSVAARLGRKTARRSAHISCRLGLPGSRLMPGAVLNVSEGGACVSAERCVPPGAFVTLRFAIPGTEPILDVGAVAVWNDGAHQTGLRFQRLHYRNAGRIRNWVQAPADSSSRRMAARPR